MADRQRGRGPGHTDDIDTIAPGSIVEPTIDESGEFVLDLGDPLDVPGPSRERPTQEVPRPTSRELDDALEDLGADLLSGLDELDDLDDGSVDIDIDMDEELDDLPAAPSGVGSERGSTTRPPGAPRNTGRGSTRPRGRVAGPMPPPRHTGIARYAGVAPPPPEHRRRRHSLDGDLSEDGDDEPAIPGARRVTEAKPESEQAEDLTAAFMSNDPLAHGRELTMEEVPDVHLGGGFDPWADMDDDPVSPSLSEPASTSTSHPASRPLRASDFMDLTQDDELDELAVLDRVLGAPTPGPWGSAPPDPVPYEEGDFGSLDDISDTSAEIDPFGLDTSDVLDPFAAAEPARAAAAPSVAPGGRPRYSSASTSAEHRRPAGESSWSPRLTEEPRRPGAPEAPRPSTQTRPGPTAQPTQNTEEFDFNFNFDGDDLEDSAPSPPPPEETWDDTEESTLAVELEHLDYNELFRKRAGATPPSGVRPKASADAFGLAARRAEERSSRDVAARPAAATPSTTRSRTGRPRFGTEGVEPPPPVATPVRNEPPPVRQEPPRPPAAGITRRRVPAATPAAPDLPTTPPRSRPVRGALAQPAPAMDTAALLTALVGGFDQAPTLRVSPQRLTHLRLDSRAGFLLSQLDGSTTIEDLIDLAILPRDETLELLYKLFVEGVIGV